jgi:monofunctional biosynthetic peptidoglycan transglycosylase
MRRPTSWGRAFLAAGFWFLAYVYLTVPDVRPLLRENPRSTAFMRLRAAEARRHGRPFRHDHRWVSYNRISPHLKRAVLVAEDSAFWQHSGVDFEQIRESIEINLERREFARGASTITQQLAKNLYLSPSRNPVRKLREWLITRRLETVLSKRRILEIYLNVIEWGDGIWGADAASRAYFRKPSSALSARDAALLAGAIVNPRVLSPAQPTARLRYRQRLILQRMGRVTPPPETAPPEAAPGPETAPLADAVPLTDTVPPPETAPTAAPIPDSTEQRPEDEPPPEPGPDPADVPIEGAAADVAQPAAAPEPPSEADPASPPDR